MATVGKTLDQLATPCFTVNVGVVNQNANKMRELCRSLGLQLRPHVKTHKCIEVGVISTNGTKRCITVSTLAEAEFFAENGFDDIVFASLFTSAKVPRMKKLAEKLSLFHVIVDNACHFELLEHSPLDNGKRWSILIKIDVGSSRAGILWDSTDEVLSLAKRISGSRSCALMGLYAHDGHSYHVKTTDDIRDVGGESARRIANVAKSIRDAGMECRTVGLGSTPSSSLPSPAMKDLTELHPGNYLFYDAQQSMLASCQLGEVAVRVATRVIGHYPHRNEMLIDAGWTSVSLDGRDAVPGGSYCLFEDQPNLKLVKMTQEVGYVQARKGKLKFENYPIGMMLLIIPYHACATACMHREYFIHDGTNIVDVWKPCSGW